MNIGEVMAHLRPDFPEVTISKIRFLEQEGLVEPARTPSGYRQFSHDDVERLRYVLTFQRDHFYPLKKIREHLDAIDRGLEPPEMPGGPRVPHVRSAEGVPGAEGYLPRRSLRLNLDELAAATGAPADMLNALESYGLVAPDAGGFYGEDAVEVAKAAGELAAFGIEARHLRAFRSAADRELGLVEQVVAAMRWHPSTESRARAEETAREISALCVRLHAALVRAGLEQLGR